MSSTTEINGKFRDIDEYFGSNNDYSNSKKRRLAKKNRSALSLSEKTSIACFSLFLCSQSFKVLVTKYTGLEIDTTLLLCVFSLLTYIYSILRGNPVYNYQLIVSSKLLIYLFLMPFLYLYFADFDAEYTLAKFSGFFTMTFMSTVLPVLLINSTIKLRFFMQTLLWSFFFSVCLTEGEAILRGALQSLNYRVDGFAANVILISRLAAGCALLAFLQLRARDPLCRKEIAMTILVISVAAAMVTASRGPLYGFVAILMLMSHTNVSNARTFMSKVLILIVFALLLYLIFPFLLSYLPETSTQKFMNAESGTRILIYKEAIGIFLDNPLGIGFAKYPDYSGTAQFYRLDYVHNLIFEYYLETGVFGGVLLCMLLLDAYRKNKPTLEYSDVYTQAFLLLVFFLLQSLVSGDMNSNRFLYAFFGIAFIKPFIFCSARRLEAS